MLRRFRRPAALTAALVVLPGLLAGCGSETSGSGLEFADRLDAVTIEGAVGEAPTVEWTQRMSAGETETETLVEGDGEPLAEGDTVFVNFLLGDGYTRELPVDTFGEDAAGVRLTVGGEPAEPASLNDLVQAFLLGQVEPGLTRGSRLVMTGDAQAVFGDYAGSPVLAESNIGNQDALLIVADVLDVEQLERPAGAQQRLPAWAPRIGFTRGEPSSMTFDDDTPEPSGTLLSAVLKEGSGEQVATGDLLVADYLGQVYEGDKPFDESYSGDKEPIVTPIGLGSVVKGWDQALVGVPVGSRVLLQIPPKLGYGKGGQGEQIPGGSTLYFVIDVLASI